MKRLDTLQMEWVNVWSDAEKLQLSTDLSFPPVQIGSLSRFYQLEGSLKTRQIDTQTHKRIINQLFDFFYVSSPPAPPEKASSFTHVEEALREKVRCKICNYIVGDLEVLRCEECGQYYHFQCLPNSQSLPGKASEIYREWVCRDCAFCGVCFNKTHNEDMVMN